MGQLSVLLKGINQPTESVRRKNKLDAFVVPPGRPIPSKSNRFSGLIPRTQSFNYVAYPTLIGSRETYAVFQDLKTPGEIWDLGTECCNQGQFKSMEVLIWNSIGTHIHESHSLLLEQMSKVFYTQSESIYVHQNPGFPVSVIKANMIHYSKKSTNELEKKVFAVMPFLMREHNHRIW